MRTVLDYDAGDYEFTLTVKASDKNDSTLSRFQFINIEIFVAAHKLLT